MKKIKQFMLFTVLAFGLYACGSQTKKEEAPDSKTEEVSVPERPSDIDLMAFKV